MKKKYQVTLYCETGVYKPVSCLIERDVFPLTDKDKRKKCIDDGIKKICGKRGWGARELVQYHYTKVKIREYPS